MLFKPATLFCCQTETFHNCKNDAKRDGRIREEVKAPHHVCPIQNILNENYKWGTCTHSSKQTGSKMYVFFADPRTVYKSREKSLKT